MMPRKEVGEASSSSSPSPSPPSPQQSLCNHSLNFHRNQNLFPGESSPSMFCRLTPSDYSLSNGLCFPEDGSSQHHKCVVSDQCNLSGDLSLCQNFHGLNIGEEEEVKTHHLPSDTHQLKNPWNYEPDDGFRYGVSYGFTDYPFNSDKSLIMGAQSFNSYNVPSMFHDKNSVRTLFDHQGSSHYTYPSRSKYDEIKGRVYSMANDQLGCRYLQWIIENGTALDAMNITNELIPHVVELMVHPFGNYLMQKLLDLCTEEQRTQIILMVTTVPGQLIRISLNAYGTRVVQRLVKSIKYKQQFNLVKSALRPGFLNLMKDLNGNHLIKHCLQCLDAEANDFIFDDAARFCLDLATHHHACSVLQDCIGYSIGQKREKLITEISRHSLFLSQDPYGNYTVQYILGLRNYSAIYMILTHLKGHYVSLSMQKFSSHMVEYCLKTCPESHLQIVLELISFSHFDLLIQHPFANYVIKAALDVTKGALHARLVDLIMPHLHLRNNPHCKRIFSGILFKK